MADAMQAGGNSRLLSSVKSVKFFLQFQQARCNAAKGVRVSAGGTVEHQLGKVCCEVYERDAAMLMRVNRS